MTALRKLAERWKAEADIATGDGNMFNGGLIMTKQQCADELLSILDAEGDSGAVGVSPEDRFEQFVAAAIARSPEPLRELGEYLTRVLDEDQWPTADRLLLQLATLARSGVVSDEDVDAAEEAAMSIKHGKGYWFPCTKKRLRAALEHFAKGEIP